MSFGSDYSAWRKEMRKQLREDYLAEAKANREKLGTILCENQFNPKMLVALKEMAKADAYPDGRFSDMEVSIWELFRYL